MNLQSYLVLAVVLILAAAAVRRMLRGKGCGSCGGCNFHGDCDSYGNCAECGKRGRDGCAGTDLPQQSSIEKN